MLFFTGTIENEKQLSVISIITTITWAKLLHLQRQRLKERSRSPADQGLCTTSKAISPHSAIKQKKRTILW